MDSTSTDNHLHPPEPLTRPPSSSETWQTVRHRPPSPSSPTPPSDFPPLPPSANPVKHPAPTAAHFTPLQRVLPSHGTTSLPPGILHLFRTPPATYAEEPDALPPSEPCLALLGVPSYLAAADLLALLPPSRSVQHIRLIRDGASYAAVLRFSSESGSEEFARRCAGKKWTGGGNWCLVRVAGVVFVERGRAVESAERVFGGVELPTCPVCLDRLDTPTSALLTTLCLHTFHPPCLASCPPRCPVCRTATNPEPTQSCPCGAVRDLWICLVCGNVGCGRYVKGCARDHFEATGHRFALEIGEGRVWDYRGDGYVHRLVRDKDGGAIALPGPDPLLEGLDGGEVSQGTRSDMVPREKVDALGLEWGHMVARELEGQRGFFEEKMREAEVRWEGLFGSLKGELDKSEEARRGMVMELEVTRAKLEVSEKERMGLRKLLEKSAERLRDAGKQLEEERALGNSLQAATQQLRAEAAARDAEIADLKETMRDLMVALEVGKRVEESDELKGGGVEVGASPAKGKTRKKR